RDSSNAAGGRHPPSGNAQYAPPASSCPGEKQASPAIVDPSREKSAAPLPRRARPVVRLHTPSTVAKPAHSHNVQNVPSKLRKAVSRGAPAQATGRIDRLVKGQDG